MAEQEFGGSCQRQPRTKTARVVQSGDQPTYRNRRKQIAGRVVERLNWKRDWGVRALPFLARSCNPGAELDKTVEAAPLPPRATVTIGVERNVDQAWPDFLAPIGVKTKPFERVGAVAVDENVRSLEQADERLPP